MKLRLPLPSFDRTPNQCDSILRNRHVITVDTKNPEAFIRIDHEALWSPKLEWSECYSWWILGLLTPDMKETYETSDVFYGKKSYGPLKRYETYYDGEIITWTLGSLCVNYRW